MGSIPIPRVERKTRDVAPQLTARAPESLAAPFTQDVPKLARAIGRTGEAVQAAAKDITQRVEKHQEDKRLELVNDTYFDTYGQLELTFQEFKARKDTAGDDIVTDFDAEYEKALGEADVKLGGDQLSMAKLRKMTASDRKRWGRELAIKSVTDREVAKATKDSAMLDKNVKSLMVDATPTGLESAREQMHEEIRETGYEENKAKQLIGIADQSLVEAYLGSIGPEQALAELDSRKLGYGALFKDVKEKENFRNMLQRKADNQKTRVDNAREEEVSDLQADTMLALQNGDRVDEVAIYQNPAVKGDPKAIKSFQTIFKNYSKEITQETKDKEYAAIMNDPDLVTMTNAQISSKVTNTDDAIKAIKWRDSILKNPAVNSPLYVEVTKSLKNDFGAGKFGTGSEGETEYLRQLKSFQDSALADPAANPADYYERIMGPINADFFDRVFNLGPSESDPVASRQREEWVNRAIAGNPDYSAAELRTYYDTNIRGKQ